MGRRGPAPTPTKVLQRRGSWLARNRPDKGLEPESGAPSPPSSLDKEAKAEWRRIIPRLVELGILTKAARGALATLCDDWSLYVTLTRQMAGAIPRERCLPDYSRLGRARSDARSAYMRACAEFGLTPSGQAGVPVAEKKPDNKADVAEKWKPRLKSG